MTIDALKKTLLESLCSGIMGDFYRYWKKANLTMPATMLTVYKNYRLLTYDMKNDIKTIA